MGNAPKPKPGKKSWGCEDCMMLFDTFGQLTRKFPCCPNCGDSDRVVEYNGRKDRFYAGQSRGSGVPNIKWSPEEAEWCLLAIRGEMDVHEVVFRTGRTRGSVHEKIRHMKMKMEVTDANRSTAPSHN